MSSFIPKKYYTLFGDPFVKSNIDVKQDKDKHNTCGKEYMNPIAYMQMDFYGQLTQERVHINIAQDDDLTIETHGW